MNVAEDLTPSVEQPFKPIFTKNSAGDAHVKWGGASNTSRRCRNAVQYSFSDKTIIDDMVAHTVFSDPLTVTRVVGSKSSPDEQVTEFSEGRGRQGPQSPVQFYVLHGVLL